MLQVVEHVTAQGQRSRRSVGIGFPHIRHSMTPLQHPIPYTSPAGTEALDVRRSRLPRIRLKALEEPDFVEIGLNNAAQDGRRGPPSGRGRPLRKSYPAELCRLNSDTYVFRPADRTDDYSAADFVISEALQQTDFDEIRHGVLSGWTAFPLGVELNYGFGGSWGLFPQSIPR